MSVSNYQIVVGIDRSDRTLDICERAHDGHCDHSVISTKPSDLHQWWVGLRERFPGRIAVAFEQPSINLLAFFEGKPVDVFAFNPSSTYSYRQSQRVLRARTDSTWPATTKSPHQRQLEFPIWGRDSHWRLACGRNGDDLRATIPKVDGNLSRDRKDYRQCDQGWRGPQDGGEVYPWSPGPQRAAT